VSCLQTGGHPCKGDCKTLCKGDCKTLCKGDCKTFCKGDCNGLCKEPAAGAVGTSRNERGGLLN
jgi:hypothetical protein